MTITIDNAPAGNANAPLSTAVSLHDYDLVAISTSGGKDSQVMLDAVVLEADRQGYSRDRIVAIHADLGRVEWKGTTDLVREQCAHYGIELHVEARPQGDILDHVAKRGKWMSSAARFCTSDHKRGQIAKVYTALAKARRAGLGGNPALKVLECIGLRAQESRGRAKKEPLAENARATNTRRTVTTWLPILAWSEADVWARIKASGVRSHEAYELGMPRLSCVFCCMAPKAALVLAGKHNRELLDAYVEVEDAIDHRFTMSVSMRDVRDAVIAGETVDPANIKGWDSF